MATKGTKVKINTDFGALSADAVPKPKEEPKKHPGGRKRKTTLKAENRTISIDPILFEKYLIIAERTDKASFSDLLRQSIELYCKSNNIALSDESLTEEATANYRSKLEAKEKAAKEKRAAKNK